jgi:FkbM family methyltransferase
MQAASPVVGTVVDVGTHIGTMMMALAVKVGSSGLFIGVEAQRNLASIAAKNAALNGHKHVHIINAAIDSSSRTCLMTVASHTNEDITNFGGFGVRLCTHDMQQSCALAATGCAPHPAPDVRTVEDNQVYTRLPAITFDSLQLRRCDLIKFHVEGWENRALEGGLQTGKQQLQSTAPVASRSVCVNSSGCNLSMRRPRRCASLAAAAAIIKHFYMTQNPN